MIDFTIETEIARAAPEVFAYVTDPELLPTWQTNTVSAIPERPGPLLLGGRLREVHRVPGGRELPSVVEVVEYERDRTFALRVVEGVPIHARMTFEPTGDGTRFSFRAHGRLTGAMRLAQPLLKISLRRQFAEQCARLKQILEEQPPVPGSARG